MIGQQAAEQIYRCFRDRIDSHLLDLFDWTAMREINAVNRATRGNRQAIDNRIDWVAQKFEAGNQRHIQLAFREHSTERRRMIKTDFPRPAMNERPGIEIFDATEPKRRR